MRSAENYNLIIRKPWLSHLAFPSVVRRIGIPGIQLVDLQREQMDKAAHILVLFTHS